MSMRRQHRKKNDGSSRQTFEFSFDRWYVETWDMDHMHTNN